MNTLEENKAILAGAPEGATHLDFNGIYLRYDLNKVLDLYHVNFKKWQQASNLICPERSITDIEQIVSLTEQLEKVTAELSGNSGQLQKRDLEMQAKGIEDAVKNIQ